MTASVGSTILGSSRSSTRTSPGAYSTAPRMRFSLLLTRSGPAAGCPANWGCGLGSVERLDRQLEVVAGGGDHLQPGGNGAQADQAGLGDGLTVVGVEDRDLVARGPVGKLSHLVVELPHGPLDAELAGQPAGLLPPQQVVHADGRRQHGGEVPRRRAVLEGGRGHVVADAQLDPDGAGGIGGHGSSCGRVAAGHGHRRRRGWGRSVGGGLGATCGQRRDQDGDGHPTVGSVTDGHGHHASRKPLTAMVRKSLLEGVLTGHPTYQAAGRRLRAWTIARKPESSSSRGAPSSRRRRPTCPPGPTVGSRDCAAARSPPWPGSASSTTPSWSEAPWPGSRRGCWTRSPAPSSSTTPSGPTCSTWPKPPTAAARWCGPGAERPSRGSRARACSGPWTRSPTGPPLSATAAWTCWLRTGSPERSTPISMPIPSARPISVGSPSSTSAPAGSTR